MMNSADAWERTGHIQGCAMETGWCRHVSGWNWVTTCLFQQHISVNIVRESYRPSRRDPSDSVLGSRVSHPFDFEMKSHRWLRFEIIHKNTYRHRCLIRLCFCLYLMRFVLEIKVLPTEMDYLKWKQIRFQHDSLADAGGEPDGDTVVNGNLCAWLFHTGERLDHSLSTPD